MRAHRCRQFANVIFQYRCSRLAASGHSREWPSGQRVKNAVTVSLVTDRGVLTAHNRSHGSTRTAGTASPTSTVRDFAMQRGSNNAIALCVTFLKMLSVLLLVVMAAVAATIAAARASLPNTCAVSEA